MGSQCSAIGANGAIGAHGAVGAHGAGGPHGALRAHGDVVNIVLMVHMGTWCMW